MKNAVYLGPQKQLKKRENIAMIVKKELRVCNFCGKEVSEDSIFTQDVPNEGQSQIIYRYNHHSYDVGGQDYCCIDCLFGDIRKHLGINISAQ
jgi:hypothetical protein